VVEAQPAGPGRGNKRRALRSDMLGFVLTIALKGLLDRGESRFQIWLAVP